MNEMTEQRRVSFQRQMARRVVTLTDSSYNPDQFMGIHVEYLYSPLLNFGKLFLSNRRRKHDFELAYAEAEDNAGGRGTAVALIISRPHDNYYIMFDPALVFYRGSDDPVFHWKLHGTPMILMNLKDFLND